MVSPDIEDDAQHHGDKIKTMFLTVLPQGSYFGDYQIIFNLPSNLQYSSYGASETLIMSISSKKFLNICEQFPRF